MKRILITLTALLIFSGGTFAQSWDWGAGIAAADDEIPTAIAVDGNGNVYVAGTFSNSVTVGNSSLTSAGRTDFFLASYSSTGSLNWIIRGGGDRDDVISDIVVNSSGDIIASGTLNGSADINGTSTSIYGGFVMKVTSAGAVSWSMGSSTTGWAGAVAVDGSDNIYLSLINGRNNKLDFGGSTLISGSAYQQSYIIKLNSQGAVQDHWEFNDAGNNSLAMPGQLVYGASGYLYFGGIHGGKLILGKWKTGNLVWHKEQQGGTGARFKNFILDEDNGRIYYGGNTPAFLDFGGPATSTVRGNPGFLALFDTSGSNVKLYPITSTVTGTNTIQSLGGMSSSLYGNEFYITGEFNTSVTFDNGLVLTADDGSFNDNDAYVLVLDTGFNITRGLAGTGTHREYGDMVESLGNGKVAVAGGYVAFGSQTAMFGNDTLPVATKRNLFVAQGEPVFQTGPPPVADFSITIVGGTTVEITNNSTDYADMVWYFGDGFVANYGTMNKVTYTFPEAGTYNVCIKVMSPSGEDSTCHSVTVSDFDPKIKKPAFPSTIHTYYGSNITTVGDSVVLVAENGAGIIYRSADNGDTWQAVKTGKRFMSFLDAGNGVVYGASGRRLTGVVFTSDSLWKSTDYGMTWQVISKIDFMNLQVIDQNGHIYGLTNIGNGSYVYKSTDGGATWSVLSNSPNNSEQVGIAANGNIVVGTYNDHIHYSTDGGATFTKSTTNIGNITIGPVRKGLDDSLYTSTYFSMYTSSDNGQSFTPWNTGFTTIKSFYFAPTGEAIVITAWGMHYAADGYNFTKVDGAPNFYDMALNSDYGFGLADSFIYRIELTGGGGTGNTPPAAPSNLQAQAINKKANNGKIQLTWQDNSNNEDGFIIFRSEGDSVNFSVIDSVGANVEAYTDSLLQSQTTYYYYVIAYNSAGNSSATAKVAGTTPVGIAVNSFEGKVTVYPNPVKDVMHIEVVLQQEQEVNIRLLDIAGREVWHREAQQLSAGSNVLRFSRPAAKAGIYLLEIYGNSGKAVIKVQLMN